MIHLPSEKRSFAPRKLMICYFLMTIQRYKKYMRYANILVIILVVFGVYFCGVAALLLKML